MNAQGEAPFFIVGSPRSGTTLLRIILCSHPRLFVPDETGFIPFLLRDPGDLSRGEVRRVLDRIGRLNRNWDNMVPDIDTFIGSLPSLTLGSVLDALYRAKIAEYGAVRWGDKTPSYALYMDTIAGIFADAQFVHVIRDGRDAVVSADAKWGSTRWYMDRYYLLRNWVRHVENARQAGQRLGPSRYLEVRYEALVARPYEVINEICAFLGEEFHPDMLRHDQIARAIIGPQGHVEVRQPISIASVGRWKTEMTPQDLKLANRVAGSTLGMLGYQVPAVSHESFQESLAFCGLTAKFTLVDGVRRILTSLGLLTLNRAKRASHRRLRRP